jgi:hypothetical protein
VTRAPPSILNLRSNSRKWLQREAFLAEFLLLAVAEDAAEAAAYLRNKIPGALAGAAIDRVFDVECTIINSSAAEVEVVETSSTRKPPRMSACQ